MLFAIILRRSRCSEFRRKGECDYSTVLELNLDDVQPSVAGPKRPQDRINLQDLKTKFTELLQQAVSENGYGKTGEIRKALHRNKHARNPPWLPEAGRKIGNDCRLKMQMDRSRNGKQPSDSRYRSKQRCQRPAPGGSRSRQRFDRGNHIMHQYFESQRDARRRVACEESRGKRTVVNPAVKASLAPGSRVVTDYLAKTGLQPYLDQLRFNLVGYGCTTCIGNSGPLDPAIEDVVLKNDVIAASVLSGNRNFEARVHQNIKANFLMSPPLVVAFALAGRVDIDLSREPIGKGKDGQDVYLEGDLAEHERNRRCAWLRDGSGDIPTPVQRFFEAESDVGRNPRNRRESCISGIQNPRTSRSRRSSKNSACSPARWKHSQSTGACDFRRLGNNRSHQSGRIDQEGFARRQYLIAHGVTPEEFNSYGARRGNDRVMTRGTFANVRIKNLMVPGTEGGVTKHLPDGEVMSIYDAAMKYMSEGIPADCFCRAGVRHGQFPRLGCQGNKTSGSTRCNRAKF